ncbi:enoyl-CoA hydratase/isomerase family protein [Actinomadura kijaniata]|uniref:Enoyl-CoA hydratase/carnithine racemase n=1 Tax=Actinomadura namibiensis TaxID=182080 RepID=A0A7W3QNK8_ACTNM|nr:enoyl-CoA hydratase-related protein [Actinomadura namibiensis]MBA8953714.1 enoyl-CoA hydratase/carnithine racemase [Actinomadura namibiensis]
MIDLQRDGDVFVLRYDSGENRFHPDFLAAVHKVLDEVAATEGPRALVTVGTGKFYSNGLDLEWLGENRDRFERYLKDVNALYARLLELPLPTVAAVNGHAFAGGAMLTLAHDVAVMRTDRGFFCLPEVDLGMSFTPGMSALIQSRLTPAVAHEAMVTGRRYTAEQAQAAGIVRLTAAEADVLPTAVRTAAELAPKDGKVVGKIRSDMYRATIEALRGPVF